MTSEVKNIFSEVEELLSEIQSVAIADEKYLEEFRIKYLGSKGVLKNVFGKISQVPNEQKKEFGQRVNALKEAAENKFNEYKEKFEHSNESGAADVDLSLPADPLDIGARHPVMTVRNEIIKIFARMGYTVAEGPEIVDDFYNFTALNFEEDHPARDMQDTFFIQNKPDVLLRTHTSTVQVQEMLKGKVPIRSIMPGRVYRNETISARAHCFFHQVEGLYIDENVSFADMKQTLLIFTREMFGEKSEIRLRPSYFPFTEPSAEMDVTCFICGAKGCPICKQTGWVEILGCGMVDPNVLEKCGIDSEKYTGFAFGMGIERITMLKFGINDIRVLSENDVRFLSQFKAAF